MTNAAEGVNKDHNVADLNKLIAECRDGMIEINAERKELNGRAGDIRERLRNSGVQIAAFNFALKLHDMESEARNDYIDSLRLNMEAMSIGSQGLLFEESDAADAADAEATHDVNEPESVH